MLRIGLTTIAILAAFLYNHAEAIGSIDLFVVPTITLRMLFGFVVLRHGRRWPAREIATH